MQNCRKKANVTITEVRYSSGHYKIYILFADLNNKIFLAGLLERPIEILKEKRPRKKVTRFMPDEISTPSPSKKVVEIKVG